MKNRKILISVMTIMLVVVLAVGLTSCGPKEPPAPPTVNLVGVVGNNEYFIEDFDLSKLKLRLVYSDNTTKDIPLTEDMISKESLSSLKFLDDSDNDGFTEKVLKVSYKGKNAEFKFKMTNNPSEKLKDFTSATMDDVTVTYDKNDYSLEVVGVPEEANATIVYSKQKIVDAGTYDIIAQIKADGYRTKELKAKLTINPKKIIKPVANEVLKYNKEIESQKAPINASEYYNLGGVTSAKDAGKYQVIASLVSSNYAWDDGTELGSQEDIAVDWTIEPQLINISSLTTEDAWNYDSNGFLFRGAGEYGIELKNNYLIDTNDPIVKPIYENAKVNVTNEQIENGEFNEVRYFTAKVTFEIVNTNYKIDESKAHEGSIVWKIYRNRLDPEKNAIQFVTDTNEVDMDENGYYFILYYNGEIQYPKIEINNNLVDADVTYQNAGSKNACREGQFYHVKAIIRKPGYETGKECEFETRYKILPKVVEVPRLKEYHLVYNKNEQHVDFTTTEDIKVVGTTCGIEPNEYKLTFSLKNTKNFVWDNPERSTEPQKVTWSIDKIKLPLTPLQWNYYDENYVYNGEQFNINLVNLEGLGLNIEYKNNSAVDAGTYTAEAKISTIYEDRMYENLEEFRKKLVYTKEWKIAPREIDFSRVKWSNTELIYFEDPDTTEYKVELEGLPEYLYQNGQLNNKIICYENNIIKASESKDVIIAPHRARYVLNKNYIESNTNVSEFVDWTVVENPIGTIIYEGKEVVYNPLGYKLIKPVILGESEEDPCAVRYFLNGVLVHEDIDIVNAAKYNLKVIVSKKGYSSFEKEVVFTIKPQKVKAPKLIADSFVYNGELQNCGLVSSNKYEVIGDQTATWVGDYTAWVQLTANNNYVWEDGVQLVDGKIEYHWSITKLAFDPSLVKWQDITEIEYNRIKQDVKLKGVPKGIVANYVTKVKDKATGEYVVVDEAINAGEYRTSVELKVINSSCYTNPHEIVGFVIADKDWKIAPKRIDVSNVRWSINNDERPLIYEMWHGKEVQHIVELKNIPEEIKEMFSFEGNIATKPGVYKATVYFANDYNNFELINKNYEDVYEWKIIENYLDWMYYVPHLDKVFNLSSDKVSGEAYEPELVINGNSPEEIAEVKKRIADRDGIEVSFELVSSSVLDATQAANVGNYKFRTYIYMYGYARKEEFVTITITPYKVDKPTVATEGLPVPNGTVNENGVTINVYNYTGKQITIPINHGENAQDNIWKNYYRMDECFMTSPTLQGTYLQPRAELINPNFIWSDNTSVACKLDYCWRIVK